MMGAVSIGYYVFFLGPSYQRTTTTRTTTNLPECPVAWTWQIVMNYAPQGAFQNATGVYVEVQGQFLSLQNASSVSKLGPNPWVELNQTYWYVPWSKFAPWALGINCVLNQTPNDYYVWARLIHS
jgi:hypothetical protein